VRFMEVSILVIAPQNPRVRYLFDEVGRQAKVSYLEFLPTPEHQLALTGTLPDQFYQRVDAQFGNPDVIVFPWPQLAPLAEKFSRAVRVYYCKDPFEYWTCWSREEIHRLESRMLGICDAVFAVSRQLAEEFVPRTGGKVFYLPNATEQSFLDAVPMARPGNLPGGKPVVGSVGQINETCDWDFIADLAANLPEARLCLVGGLEDENPDRLRKIAAELAGKFDIHFLGPQPHENLPAFMQHFDISLCLLKPGGYADRRGPLRLYDYLTTPRPIISTAVREAREHLPHIHIAEDGRKAAKLARRILAGEFAVDVAARRKYIERHTWGVRAEELLGYLDRVWELGKKRRVEQ
jgi:glycosyltransferase involved in cell wall biosynthesis